MVREAEQASGRGDAFRARDLFQQALAIEPLDEDALFGLGSLYERMGNNPPGIMARQDLWMDAIKAYEKLIEAVPGHVEARVRAGYTYLRYGECEGTGEKAFDQFKKAAQRLDEALELDPRHAGAWYARAYAHLHANQQEGAIAAFSRVTALDPKHVDAWWNLGILQEQHGRYQEALDAIQHASSLDPKREGTDGRLQRLRIRLVPARNKGDARGDDAALARLDTGTKLLSQSNFPKAIQFLSQAMRHFEAVGNPTGQLEAARHIAAAHKALRQWGPAREALVLVLELAAGKGDRAMRAEASHNLGYVSYLAGNPAGAIEHFTEAVALHREIGDAPKVADGLANLGRSYRQAGDYARALNALEEALQADVDTGNLPNQAKDHCEIAETHDLAGDSAKAGRHYRSAVAIYQQLKQGWNVAATRKRMARASRPGGASKGPAKGTRGRP
ncbi:MAG: tetratricopeptide repeat protein [Candidatus Lokiarchaeota archaeon]|nr:tetratricopeptide repeat protein [Candidatus Lokiarchaeota archaeon]